MFSNRDTGSQRRRRETQQVELRKQRTEELLSKKRQATESGEKTTSFVHLKPRLYSECLEEIYNAIYECRTILSVEINPPIQEIIDTGIVPRIIKLLNKAYLESLVADEDEQGDPEVNARLISKIRLEAAWTLTNIAAGNSSQTEYIVSINAVPPIIEMLFEEDHVLVDQAIWALGNVAGDSIKLRNMILDMDVLPIIIRLIEKYRTLPKHIKILRNLVWVSSSLVRGRDHPPHPEILKLVFNTIEPMAFMNDQEIVADSFWCFSYIADVGGDMLDMVVRSELLNRCYSLMEAFTASLNKSMRHDTVLAKIGAFSICPMIRMLGNVVTGPDDATEIIIEKGFLRFFSDIYYKYDNKKVARVRKEICWLISNVAAGTEAQAALLCSTNLVELLIDAISHYELFIRREALFALESLMKFCEKNPHYLERFLDNQMIDAFGYYLESIKNTPEEQSRLLDTLKIALEVGNSFKHKLGENPVVQKMMETKLVDEVESLQDTGNADVVKKAYDIIVMYFEGEEE